MFGESEPDISRRRTPLQGNEEGERSNFTSDFIMHFKTLPKEIIVESYDDFSFAVEGRWLKERPPLPLGEIPKGYLRFSSGRREEQ